jgi:chromosome segregation ATPase
MMRKSVYWLALPLLIAPLLHAAQAEDGKPNREREALRKAQQQLAQTTQARTALQEKLTLTEKDLEELRKNVDKLQTRSSSESAKNKSLQTELAAAALETQTLRTQKSDLEQRLATATARIASTEKELLQAQQQRKLLTENLQAKNLQVTSCLQNNKDLYAAGRGLIEQCRDESNSARLLRLEPLSGTSKVLLENKMEAVRDKLDAAKILPPDSTQ